MQSVLIEIAMYPLYTSLGPSLKMYIRMQTVSLSRTPQLSHVSMRSAEMASIVIGIFTVKCLRVSPGLDPYCREYTEIPVPLSLVMY